MAISLANIRRGVEVKPPRLLVYGTHGVGKTTFGAGAPAPILLPLEDGAGVLDIPRFDLLQSYGQVVEALNALGADESGTYSTIIVDSPDWLEPMVWAEACARNSWVNIEAPGYGKGYQEADKVWTEFFGLLQALRDYRNMQVILIAHQEVKTFQDPTTDPYDRYQIKLHKGATGLAQEWADAVLFATFKTHTTKSKGSFGRESIRGVGMGDRVLYTQERPAHYAKNRYNLPYELPLSYEAFANAIGLALPKPAAEAAAAS